MRELMKNEMNKIENIFEECNDTLVLSCIQGVMGRAWVDDYSNPKSVQVITADFCMFNGVANEELVRNIPIEYKKNYIFMVPENNEWEKLIEKVYVNKYKRFMRYSIKKEGDIFDRSKLNEFIDKLPCDYKLFQIDERIYNEIINTDWAEDLCSNFSTYEEYKKLGLGYVIKYNDEIVCGASSYTAYKEGIEIEIDTKQEFRRRGLATVCAAKLILECLDRGLYPSWDAHNMASVGLSEKLGYHFNKEYVTYGVKL